MTEDVIIPAPTPELEEDPAVAALEMISRGDRRSQVKTLVVLALLVVAFAVLAVLVWRVNVRADAAIKAVDDVAEAARLAALIDCREVDYERAQGALVSTLVGREADRSTIGVLAADYARASARLEQPLTAAEEKACLAIYGSILERERGQP